VSATARGRADKPARSGEFKCPECGRLFARPQALGAHRRQAHGVVGESKRSQARANASRRSRWSSSSRPGSGRANRSGRNSGAIDRNTLLKTVFPEGIPAREDVIRAVEAWLAEAERMAKIR
jgi:uncharacterized C2H2 Zn-finger protein